MDCLIINGTLKYTTTKQLENNSAFPFICCHKVLNVLSVMSFFALTLPKTYWKPLDMSFIFEQ